MSALTLVQIFLQPRLEKRLAEEPPQPATTNAVVANRAMRLRVKLARSRTAPVTSASPKKHALRGLLYPKASRPIVLYLREGQERPLSPPSGAKI